RGRRTLVQPGVKVRGPEYLRIIYGPEYTAPHNLERLRDRNLGRKRSLALREFALGIEALERFVRGEPLRNVHECVFGVLALESEPVDPPLVNNILEGQGSLPRSLFTRHLSQTKLPSLFSQHAHNSRGNCSNG